jgi:predicted nucleic acid-binding protein
MTGVVVPDASVLLKWVLESDDERDRDQALALRHAWLSGSCEIVVPSLWTYEVGNILGLKRPSAARALLEAMTALELDEVGPSAYLEQIYHLVGTHRVTFYDAAYHGLAIQRSGTLVTADGAYLKKTAASGHVELLATWRGPRHG